MNDVMRTYTKSESEAKSRVGFVPVYLYAKLVPEPGEIGSIVAETDGERHPVERIFLMGKL